MTQPPLSQAIAALEELLGAPCSSATAAGRR
jgi:DNA-binding transcriptional LysR family regulator